MHRAVLFSTIHDKCQGKLNFFIKLLLLLSLNLKQTLELILERVKKRHHDTPYDDIQHNGIHQNDIQHGNISIGMVALDTECC
jgi:hypothetical protein